jgi:hypothetical protein
MPWQLIYTSAPRGLHSGQSGFCTVARSADLREALVQRLEQISSYHYLNAAEAALTHRNPTICAFRILDLRGTKYHVLTRIQPCGLDFTSRTNHLAHHLVFQAGDLASLPSPASILRYWDGWLGSWQEEPRLLDGLSSEAFASAARFCLPAQTWLRVTGDAGRAAGLLGDDCIRGCYLVCPTGGATQVLEMFCETLQLLNPNGQYALRPWRHPFTTLLQAEDNPADFQWRACQEGTPGYQQAFQRSALLTPLASVPVPGNSLATVAREGLNAPALQPAASSSSAPDGWPPEDRRPPAPEPGSKPAHPPIPSRRSPKRSLILAYATVKQRQTMLQRWFSNLSVTGRVGMGLFAAVLLGLLAMLHAGCRRHAMSEGSPAAPVPAPGDGNRGGPASGQTTPPKPAPAPVEPIDSREWAWLLEGGPTYVFATTDFTRFELPMHSIGQFQRLLRSFDLLETQPTNIQLLVNTNMWASAQLGLPMPVNARPLKAPELSAGIDKEDLGIHFYFSNWSTTNVLSDYTNWVSTNMLPMAVGTTFSTPPRALSIQFRVLSSSNLEPFRLLIVNATAPPPVVELPAPWLQAGVDEALINEFTFLQGQRLQIGASKKALIITNLSQREPWVPVFRFDP